MIHEDALEKLKIYESVFFGDLLRRKSSGPHRRHSYRDHVSRDHLPYSGPWEKSGTTGMTDAILDALSG